MKRQFISALLQQIKAFASIGSRMIRKPARRGFAVAEPVESRVMLSAAVPAISSIVPAPAGNGITGEYFAGNNFQQAEMVRTDPAISFSQPVGTPERVIPPGPYSVQWTGQVEALFSETYTFSVRTNGGVRVYVNDQLLIDDFTPHHTSTSSGTIALQVGQKYDLRVDYFQNNDGPSKIHLRWSSASQPNRIIPRADLFSDQTVTLPGGVGLTGEYFNSIDLTHPVLTRLDKVIDFDWLDHTPDAEIPTIPFSVKWTGQVQAKFSEAYKFYTYADDGTRLYINGQLVIDNWNQHAAELAASKPIQLQAGQEYSVELDYYANGIPPSSVKFLWSSAHTRIHVVPSSALSSTAGAPSTPAGVTTAADSSSQVTISWDAVPGATNYLVERSTTPDGSSGFTTVGTTSATMLVDTGLQPATTYYYRVTAENTAGNSVPAALTAGTTLTVAPVNLTAMAASDTQVNLAWNDVSGETGFVIESSPDGMNNWIPVTTVGAGTTSVKIAQLTPSTTYYYRVLASDAGGSSAPSNVATVTTDAPIPAYAAITTIYGLTTLSNSVYSIDTTTGAAALIGSLSFGTSAAGRDPVTGNFYYISTGATTAQIAVWNPAAPAASANTLVNGSVPVSGVVTRAAFRDNGTFFFIAGTSELDAYNTTTNTATRLGTITLNGSPIPYDNGDMAFAPDGTLYIETAHTLYSVAPSAIAAASGPASQIPATEIGSTGTMALQVAFGQNGVLYGYDPSGQVYTVDESTAVATPVPGSTPSGVPMGDLASVPLYADLSLTQSASALAAGSNGTYTFTVSNTGPDATIRPIIVTDTLPAGLTFVSAVGTGWTFNVSGQTLTMAYGGNAAKNTTLPAVTLTVGVVASAMPSVTNTAVVSTTIFDTNTANNTSTLTTSVS